MEKFIYHNNLFLIYKNLLKDKSCEIFDLYYGENLSMQEIADLKGISKSRVGAIIKDIQERLEEYEKALGLYQKNVELNNLLEINDIEKIKNKIKDILK